jgi:hypothetical protein
MSGSRVWLKPGAFKLWVNCIGLIHPPTSHDARRVRGAVRRRLKAAV